jgi:hypothetical protein
VYLACRIQITSPVHRTKILYRLCSEWWTITMRKEGCISTGPSRALATVMYLVWIRLFLKGTYLALPLIVQPACILYSHKRQDNLPHLSPRQRMNFRVSTTYSIPLSICISTFHHHDFERYVIYVAQYDYVILIQTVLMLTLIPNFSSCWSSWASIHTFDCSTKSICQSQRGRFFRKNSNFTWKN